MMVKKYLFFILTITSIFIGCGSKVPYSTTFPTQTQRKMQAAKHWEVLAEDVAGQVKKCIAERKDLMVKPVYVVPKDETPFGKIFHDILISKLVTGGVLVSMVDKEAMKMEYNVQILEHSDRNYSKYPFKFTALGAGVMVAREISDWALDNLLVLGAGAGLLADIGMSRYAGSPSHREAVITTFLSYGDYYFMHQSDIYYINDPDAGHYINMEESQQKTDAPGYVATDVVNDSQEELELEENIYDALPEDDNSGANRRKFNVVD